ncbi:MAG: hypothetical protein JST67_08695 [Bacteroidetes bacterium]|nr:hypothetical protein [Bacteroidota bacterium]
MKILIRLFLAFFCLFTLQPLMTFAMPAPTETETCVKNCCHTPDKKEKTKTRNCCENGVCNPLSVCSCCLHAVQKSNDIVLTRMALEEKRSFTEPSFTLKKVSFSCFHPPEIN